MRRKVNRQSLGWYGRRDKSTLYARHLATSWRYQALRALLVPALVVLCTLAANAENVILHNPDTMAIAPTPERAIMAVNEASTTTAGDEVPEFVEIVAEDCMRIDMVLPDSIFYGRAEAAIFKVNKWDLDMASPVVRRIETEVLPIARRNGWVLVGLQVRGAASPEGPLRWNVTLSENRARALTEYLHSRFLFGTARLKTNTVAEDYPYLHRMMREAGDPDADRVGVAILQNDGDMVRVKRALQQMDGGRLWRRLLREYYPQLRAARVILYFLPQQAPTLSGHEVSIPEVGMERPVVEPLPIPVRGPRQHILAVRTNLLYDFMYWPDYGFAPSPNIELEFYPKRGHFTYNIGLTTPYWHRWHRHKFWQIRHYTLGARYYFHPEKGDGTMIDGRPLLTHTGWFVGADVMNSIYGIGFSDKRGWEGEGLGAQVTGGYVLPLCRSHRWRLEFTLGLGLWYTRYDPYVYGDPKTGTIDGDYYYDYTGRNENFHKRNHQLWWLGPTNVGINLTWDVFNWKDNHR